MVKKSWKIVPFLSFLLHGDYQKIAHRKKIEGFQKLRVIPFSDPPEIISDVMTERLSRTRFVLMGKSKSVQLLEGKNKILSLCHKKCFLRLKF